MSNEQTPKLTRPPQESPLRTIALGCAMAGLAACTVVVQTAPGIEPKGAPSPVRSGVSPVGAVPHPTGLARASYEPTPVGTHIAVGTVIGPPGVTVYSPSPSPVAVGNTFPDASGLVSFEPLAILGVGQPVRIIETWRIESALDLRAFVDAYGTTQVTLPVVNFDSKEIVAISVNAGCGTTVASLSAGPDGILVHLNRDCQTDAPGPGTFLFVTISRTPLPIMGAKLYTANGPMPQASPVGLPPFHPPGTMIAPSPSPQVVTTGVIAVPQQLLPLEVSPLAIPKQ
jgi:hypothetical protein